MLADFFMRLAPNSMPEPRLISSLDAEETLPPDDGPTSLTAGKGVGISARKRHWIYAGILGAMVVSVIALVFGRSAGKNGEQPEFRILIKAKTHSLAASAHSAETPAPVVVQLSADVLRVTAIALGHPRLAIVNGKPVSEGDTIVVHTPNRSVATTLRVVKISDGRIDFSDGSKVFCARLTVPPRSQATAQ